MTGAGLGLVGVGVSAGAVLVVPCLLATRLTGADVPPFGAGSGEVPPVGAGSGRGVVPARAVPLAASRHASARAASPLPSVGWVSAVNAPSRGCDTAFPTR